jgi:arylsulfatase A-like enzyme
VLAARDGSDERDARDASATRDASGSPPRNLPFVLACTLAIAPFFAALKVFLIVDDLHAGATARPGALRLVARFALAVHRDLLFLVVMGAVALGLLALAGRRPWARAATRACVLGGYGFVAAWTAGTYFLWRVVAGMLTPSLYRLSGGLGNLDPGVAASVRAVAPWLLASAALCAALALALERVLPMQRLYARPRRFGLAFGVLTLGLLGCTVRYRKGGIDMRETPVAFFVGNWLVEPKDFGHGEHVAIDETSIFGKLVPMPATPAPPRAAPGKKPNVILLVLESEGASYMHAFQGKWDNTPVLDGLKSSALFFDHAYAHAPLTNESALTLQCSVHPRTGAAPTVGAGAQLRMPDLAGELKSLGYATAFMCQTLLGWQGQEFFRERHFDHYSEAFQYWRDWGGTRKMDDRDLLPRAFGWIDARPKDEPFFLMMWTYQGHYPCYSVDAPRDYEPGQPAFNRYLNAIREDDRFVGALLAELGRRGILDSTLVVITGDHGQVFSKEVDERATRNLTELAVRVPLVFIQPGLVGRSGVDGRLARHIDVAPTILDLLGRTAPKEWQGRSLFAAERSTRVLLTSSYTSPPLYGLVDGNAKYVTDGEDEYLFDLSVDPGEHHNLAKDGACPLCREYHDALVAWHRSQPTYLAQFTVH